MKQNLSEFVELPEGVSCEFTDGVFSCKKGDVEIKKKISSPVIDIKVEDGKIEISSKKGNKRVYNSIKTNIAHVKNMLRGLDEKFVYELEICNVHFPMTVKVEGNRLIISNFLGEKEKRFAKIVEGVDVEVKGNKVIVSGRDVENAGQTAANIEKASKVTNKDKRVFQDGIFMVSKKGVAL